MKNKNLLIIAGVVAVLAIATSGPVRAFATSVFNGDSTSQTTNNQTGTNTFGTNNGNQTGATNGADANLAVATVSNGVQKLTTQHQPTSYPNIVVQKGMPVEWTINASAPSLQSCNSYVDFPSLNMQGQLKQGDNLIKFTPTNDGTFTYQCSMGMYHGSITVVDDLSNFDKSSVQTQIDNTVPTAGTGGGCCGG